MMLRQVKSRSLLNIINDKMLRIIRCFEARRTLLSVGHGLFSNVLTFFRVYTIVLSLTCIAGFFADAIWSRDDEMSWRDR
jgi:hypothetical protein